MRGKGPKEQQEHFMHLGGADEGQSFIPVAGSLVVACGACGLHLTTGVGKEGVACDRDATESETKTFHNKGTHLVVGYGVPT